MSQIIESSCEGKTFEEAVMLGEFDDCNINIYIIVKELI